MNQKRSSSGSTTVTTITKRSPSGGNSLSLVMIPSRSRTFIDNMSQQQPERPQQEPIKYEDLFSIKDAIARKLVAPRDAAMMQVAENVMLGETQKGGAASAMQSGVAKNEKAGFVGYKEMNEAADERGVSIKEIDMHGRRMRTESIAGHVNFFS